MTEEIVLNTIAKALRVSAGELRPDDGPGTVVAWDSLASIEVVIALERLLGRRLDLDQLAVATTVSNLTRLVITTADTGR